MPEALLLSVLLYSWAITPIVFFEIGFMTTRVANHSQHFDH